MKRSGYATTTSGSGVKYSPALSPRSAPAMFVFTSLLPASVFTDLFLHTQNLTYWNVLYQDSFGHKLRKYFAPLMGELKPDTPAVRSLLREAHWL